MKARPVVGSPPFAPEVPTTSPAELMSAAELPLSLPSTPRLVRVPPLYKKALIDPPKAASPTIWPASLIARAELYPPPWRESMSVIVVPL